MLHGITIMAAGSSENKDHFTEIEILNVRQTTQIELDEIKIEDSEFWEVRQDKQSSELPERRLIRRRTTYSSSI